jgi:predicted acylesterase/phospholipase RssA
MTREATMGLHQFTLIASALLAATGLQACGTLPRRSAVPPDLTERAVIPGIANSRFWLDRDLGPFVRSIVEDNRREEAALAKAGRPTDPMPPVHFLAISGGGDAGAFGAGLLSGWSAHGDRPEFKVVTGISAGALIAPFAFLGPAYDDVIRTVATSVGKDGIFHTRNALSGLTSDGMADSEPLARLVAHYVTPDVLAAIALEFEKGRVLEIGTTDLDAGRAVTWNMGAIAASNSRDSLELFRKIMVASASIPGAVSPVMIGVEVDGKRYQEMHVDGGVITQVFAYPTRTLSELLKTTGTVIHRQIAVYVIRNGKLEPEWSDTPRRTLKIGGRAIGALVQAQGVGDLRRIYQATQRDGFDFNLAYIGSDFPDSQAEPFNTAYMRSLFDYAYQAGVNGYPWHKAPPGELSPDGY